MQGQPRGQFGKMDAQLMADAKWMEYRLFCPICNDYFTQLVVLDELPKNFTIDRYLAGIVEGHNHKVFQGAKAQSMRSNTLPLKRVEAGDLDMSDFEVYADEPSIIYEFSKTDCPADIFLDHFGEICASWLRHEYPKCTFVYEPESCTLFLDGGHGLSAEQIGFIQSNATAFVRGSF
jgi:hypothetical protein